MYKHKTLCSSILLFCLILAGCGFHLRGQEQICLHLKALFIESSHPYGAFTKQLKRILISNKVILTDQPSDAPYTLQILNESFTQTITGVGSTGQITTYQLNYMVMYQLKDASGKVIQSPRATTSARNYAISSSQILGDTSALQSLQEEMRRDLVYQILNNLRTITLNRH